MLLPLLSAAKVLRESPAPARHRFRRRTSFHLPPAPLLLFAIDQIDGHGRTP